MFGHDDDQQQNDLPKKSKIIEPVADASLAGSNNATQVTTEPSGPPMPSDFSFTPTAPADSPEPKSEPAPATNTPTSAGSDDLLNIKQQALQQLNPLLSHLEQTPEEKFKTTMMMIQATDDQSLLKTAHEAALNIKDEKERAQALLDVVNEINYFTQPHENQA